MNAQHGAPSQIAHIRLTIGDRLGTSGSEVVRSTQHRETANVESAIDGMRPSFTEHKTNVASQTSPFVSSSPNILFALPPPGIIGGR